MGAAWSEPFQEEEELPPVWNTSTSFTLHTSKNATIGLLQSLQTSLTELQNTFHSNDWEKKQKLYYLNVSSWTGPLQQVWHYAVEGKDDYSCDVTTKSTLLFHTSILHLAFPLQLSSQPLKVAVSPPDTGLLQLEYGEVCLWRTRTDKQHQKHHIHLKKRPTSFIKVVWKPW